METMLMFTVRKFYYKKRKFDLPNCFFSDEGETNPYPAQWITEGWHFLMFLFYLKTKQTAKDRQSRDVVP